MYKLMYKEEVIAEAVKRAEMLYVLKARENVPQQILPFGLFGVDKREVTMLDFVNWASERCFPEERVGAKKLLEELGLDRYDGWEIVKKTNAELPPDHYWIDFGEGRYE